MPRTWHTWLALIWTVAVVAVMIASALTFSGSGAWDADLVILAIGFCAWIPIFTVLVAPRRKLSWAPLALIVVVLPVASIGLGTAAASTCSSDDADCGGFAVLGVSQIVLAVTAAAFVGIAVWWFITEAGRRDDAEASATGRS